MDVPNQTTPPGKKETGLQPAFTITVEDPQKVEDPIGAFIMYTVHCNDYGSPIACASSPFFRDSLAPLHDLSAHHISLSRHPMLRMVALPSPLSCRRTSYRAVSAVVLGSRTDKSRQSTLQPTRAMTDRCIL